MIQKLKIFFEIQLSFEALNLFFFNLSVSQMSKINKIITLFMYYKKKIEKTVIMNLFNNYRYLMKIGSVVYTLQ